MDITNITVQEVKRFGLIYYIVKVYGVETFSCWSEERAKLEQQRIWMRYNKRETHVSA